MSDTDTNNAEFHFMLGKTVQSVTDDHKGTGDIRIWFTDGTSLGLDGSDYGIGVALSDTPHEFVARWNQTCGTCGMLEDHPVHRGEHL